MLEFLFFVICTGGLVHLVVEGSILEGLRDFVRKSASRLGRPDLGKVVDCYLCSGFWCGIVMALIWVTFNPVQVFACGVAGSFIGNYSAALLNYLEAGAVISVAEEKE